MEGGQVKDHRAWEQQVVSSSLFYFFVSDTLDLEAKKLAIQTEQQVQTKKEKGKAP